jgi:hypothetical protein
MLGTVCCCTLNRIGGLGLLMDALQWLFLLKGVRYHCSSFVILRESGTFVLKGVDELQTLLDEHITATQQIAFSAFKKPFAERIDT